MTRALAIWIAVLGWILAAYAIGTTHGYSGCVAGASELHTNKILRSM